MKESSGAMEEWSDGSNANIPAFQYSNTATAF
jgi:hypothetical protein